MCSIETFDTMFNLFKCPVLIFASLIHSSLHSRLQFAHPIVDVCYSGSNNLEL